VLHNKQNDSLDILTMWMYSIYIMHYSNELCIILGVSDLTASHI